MNNELKNKYINTDWKEMNLNNYIDIKEMKLEIENRKNALRTDRKNIIAPLYAFSKEHPELIGEALLPSNLEISNLNNLNLRFEIIKQNIENSSMTEIEKEKILKTIEYISKNLERNIASLKLTEKSEEKIKKAEEARTAYLEEKYLEYQVINEQLFRANSRHTELSKRRNELVQEGWVEQDIVNGFDKAISAKQNEVNELQRKLAVLLEDPRLKDELELFAKDRKISQIHNSELEQKEEQNLDNLNESKELMVVSNEKEQESTDNVENNEQTIDENKETEKNKEFEFEIEEIPEEKEEKEEQKTNETEEKDKNSKTRTC